MTPTTESSAMQIGIGTILFIVFLTLKLTDTIDWSWWWISAPLWIPAGIVAAAYTLAALLTYTANKLDK
ncbi:membrane protein [Mycobacterium phage SmellyB]|uniref:Uncharacterized protein n=3 Tax=Gladiatorvirus ericB TaxID=1041406 RepID=A0A2P1N2F9_9CAUD|nr:hypothetical protein PBI_KAZAN_70 [Mycobacterium phage Kazan]AVP42189.1 hypothetical protein SEA_SUPERAWESOME_69 [Mycobacterium phage SuperAwesome]QXO14820.1 membrane protein [Mycobacterium phage SmellyB]